MKYVRYSRFRRSAFTLVELIVVIGIIAVLIAILLPAVNQVISAATRAQTIAEISQLSQAIAAAKSDLFGSTNYPLPAQLVLRENCDYNLSNPLENNSRTLLVKAFGKFAIVPGNPIDWNGDGVIDPPGTARVLYGYDALVFWLGGIPQGAGAQAGLVTPGVLGFANNTTNPSIPGGTRRGPYFDGFRANRLFNDTINPTSPGYFLYYADPYSSTAIHVPYAYFTSYKGNDYTLYGNDCPNLPGTPSPYMTSATNFINANGFQIISAGKNFIFGLGGTSWNPTLGYGAGPGADDLATFSGSVLGAPQS